jgi:hypothetical protein
MDRENRWVIVLVVGGILLVMLVVCAAVFIIFVAFFGLRAAQPLPPPPVLVVPTEAPVPSVVPPAASATPFENNQDTETDNTQDDDLDDSLDSEMEAVEDVVVDLRGLPARQDVPRSLITPEELRQQVTEEFFEDYTDQDAADEAIVLSAFGFLPADLDLYALYIDLYSEQIAGYYDTEEEAFYVISSETGTLNASDEFIYAHEYTHALQDQHFDLDAFLYNDDDAWWEVNADEGLARLALIEGDATLLQMLYLGTMSQEEVTEMIEEITALDTPIFNSAPKYIRQSLLFPYDGGLVFVQALHDKGGFDLVDAAYEDPPLSTEHILHPERYFDGDDPQVVELEDDLAVLGDDYRLVLPASTFGEFNLRMFLQEHMTGTGAEQAAEGWDGDLFAAYHNDGSGDTVVVMLTVWDSPGEAQEYVDLIDITWQTGQDVICHEGQNLTCVTTLAADETLTVIAPDRDTVDLILDNYR